MPELREIEMDEPVLRDSEILERANSHDCARIGTAS
jgi:hypothetical protein